MKRKVIVVGPEARARVLRGAKFAADAVKLTIGPYGRNFASGIKGGPVAISNDGVSLLREIEGADEIEDLGVRAVREAATKTNDIAGDGTTASAVLTNAILEALKMGDSDIVSTKQSPVEMIERVQKEKNEIVGILKASAKKVESKEELIKVAQVSGEYPELAELIGAAQWEVGPNGTVLAEEANSNKDSVEFIHGVRLDNGYSTSRIINNQEKQSLELEDVYVILTNKVFHGNFKGLEHIFDSLVKRGAHNVVIMGRAFDDAAIGVCVKNIQEGALKLYPLNCPYVDQNEVMEDLAAVLGARYINIEERNVETMLAGDVGHASKIMAKRFEGIIAGFPTGHDVVVDERVKTRIEQLEEKLKGNVSPFERRNIEARMSQLVAGTAVIRVGADTDQKRKHKKDKVDDAVNAVKAALQEGTVAGGGLALWHIGRELPDTYLLKKALSAPHVQIMSLAPSGFKVEEWVRDPVKVIHTALTHACDIASSLATTEVAINFEREKPQYAMKVDNQIAEYPEE